MQTPERQAARVDDLGELQRLVRQVCSEVTGRDVDVAADDRADGLGAVAPLVRKLVRETLDDMAQRATEARVHALTWHGIRWRVAAWRSGRSFSELVLARALVYEVLEVLLMHRETGQLLQYAVTARQAAPIKEPGVVAGMLTAIEYFVQDAFSTRHGDALDTLKMGELTIWIEHGARVCLAAVLRGVAPEARIRGVLQDALARIEQDHQGTLQQCPINVASFEATQDDLQACLQSAGAR